MQTLHLTPYDIECIGDDIASADEIAKALTLALNSPAFLVLLARLIREAEANNAVGFVRIALAGK